MKNWLKSPWGLMVAMGTVVGLSAAGVYTNGFRQVGPLAGAVPFGAWDHLHGSELVPVDTQNAQGAFPQTVAASPFHFAAFAAGFAANTGTTSSGAVTISKVMGTITTESIATAVGSTYTITLTNTAITASKTVLASIYPVSDVTLNRVVITSITPAAGSVVIVVKNEGTSALSGTWAVPFMIVGN